MTENCNRDTQRTTRENVRRKCVVVTGEGKNLPQDDAEKKSTDIIKSISGKIIEPSEVDSKDTSSEDVKQKKSPVDNLCNKQVNKVIETEILCDQLCYLFLKQSLVDLYILSNYFC